MIIKLPTYRESIKYDLHSWDRRNNPYLMDFVRCTFHPDREAHKLSGVKREAFELSLELDRKHKIEGTLSSSRFYFRDTYTESYSWAIPDHAALKAIQGLSPNGVMDLGCGAGYWAHMLTKMGVNVVAYDIEDRNDVDYGRWFKHKKRSFRYALKRESHRRTLLLSWPDYESPMAYNCLRGYRGNVLAYVGEGSYGCTADERFHDLLEKEEDGDWHLLTEVDIPQWMGIHDSLRIYVRKE